MRLFCIFLSCFALVCSSASAANTVAGCPMFPKDNWWNTKIHNQPKDPRSKDWILSQSGNPWLGYNFNSGKGKWGTPGMPLNIVSAKQKGISLKDAMYGVDPGLYPIPRHPRMQRPTDRHMLILQKGECKLFELWQAKKTGSGWQASQATIWDLNKNQMRMQGDTSADAAGFSVTAGIIRKDEIGKKRIEHALRTTLPDIQRGWIWPATHTDGNRGKQKQYPPMGIRLRLTQKAWKRENFTGQSKKIARAMREYGLFLSDSSGTPDQFYSGFEIQGESDPRWDEENLAQLSQLRISDFEFVKNTHPIINPEW